jgi:hypothetical protein
VPQTAREESERAVKYSPRRPRIGFVGRNCGTPDSDLNYRLTYMLAVDSWLVENDPKLPVHPAATGMLYTVYRGEPSRAKKFLKHVDVVVFVDEPLYLDLLIAAMEMSKKVVCIVNDSGYNPAELFVTMYELEHAEDPRRVIEIKALGASDAADCIRHGGEAEAGGPAPTESPAVPTEPRVVEGDRAGSGVDEEAHDGRRLADLRRAGVVGVSPLRPCANGQRDECAGDPQED